MSEDWEEKFARLERRVLAIEGKLFHAGHLSMAVRTAVEAQDGEFTSSQIRDVVYLRHPHLKPEEDQGQVAVVLRRLELAGQVVCVEKGRGPKPNVYLRGKGSMRPVRAGSKRGQKHGHESGFRSVVRAALSSGKLPDPFTVRDLRDWCAEHSPEVRVPYGTWSSTLYKLEQSGELVALQERVPSRQFGSLKAFRVGPVRVAPSGDVPTEKEADWASLRESMGIKLPEMLTPNERGWEGSDEAEAASAKRSMGRDSAPLARPRRQYGAIVQKVRAIPFGQEFTVRDFNGAGGPGLPGLLQRMAQGGEIECVRPATRGGHGSPAVYRRPNHATH